MNGPPGRRWYAIAAGVFLLGIAVCAAFVFLRLRGLGDELPQIVVPGSAELRLGEPGRYTIFHETESVVDGRYYAPSDVSGLYVTVVSTETGEEVPLEEQGAETTYSVGGRAGRGVLVFDIARPGVYEVSGSYDGGQGTPTVIAVGHGFGRKLVLTIGGAIAIGFLGFALAATIGIVTFFRRRRARSAAPAAT